IPLTDGTKSPWCKLPFSFTAQYFQAGVNRFKEAKRLRFNLSEVDQDHRELCRNLVYPKKRAYMEKYVSHKVQMMKLIMLPIARRATDR
ncbi:hypothetical protein KI387_036790, partial [Taxus chinensis]